MSRPYFIIEYITTNLEVSTVKDRVVQEGVQVSPNCTDSYYHGKHAYY